VSVLNLLTVLQVNRIYRKSTIYYDSSVGAVFICTKDHKFTEGDLAINWAVCKTPYESGIYVMNYTITDFGSGSINVLANNLSEAETYIHEFCHSVGWDDNRIERVENTSFTPVHVDARRKSNRGVPDGMRN
jgi:hypothetical protein